MKFRPMLFSGSMVRALLAGTKTQTRRVVKPQPEAEHGGEPYWFVGGYRAWIYRRTTDLLRKGGNVLPCPYGQPGDRLWVKETTIKVEDHGWIGPVYAESEQGKFALDWGYGEPDDPDHIPPHDIKLRPSLFMTRAMSRITLEITGVRVERLQDISEADAKAEGADPFRLPVHPSMEERRHSSGFALLWEQINGTGSWDANPWVWVVEFRRVQP